MKNSTFCLQKLNEDICRLSTLCTQNQKSTTQSLPQDVILNAFKNWQENKEASGLDLLVRSNEVRLRNYFGTNGIFRERSLDAVEIKFIVFFLIGAGECDFK